MANVTHKESSEIVRYAGDTHPVNTELVLNGVPMDLDGWSIVCRCEVPLRTDTGVIKLVTQIIDCVVTDAALGKINIYPNMRHLVVGSGDVGMSGLVSVDGEVDGTVVATYDADASALVGELKDHDHVTDLMELTDGVAYTSNQCWTRRELLGADEVTYTYSIVREKDYDLGDTLPYREVMTCLTGKVILKKRV